MGTLDHTGKTDHDARPMSAAPARRHGGDSRMRRAPGLLGRALRRPGAALGFLWGRARGAWYRFWLPLTGRRFRAGRGLLVHGRLIVRGPGRVVLGDHVKIRGRVTPWTYAGEAVIEIGDRTDLQRTRFGCMRRISLGADCIVADCRIMDTDFHSVQANRHDAGAPVRVAEVVVEDNVWIAGQSGILPGTVIGRDSVVSFGSVCSGRYPSDVVLMGNPARVAARIPDKQGEARAPRRGQPVDVERAESIART